MKIFGIQLGKTKSNDAQATDVSHLSNVDSSEAGWWPIIREGFAGAWQENVVFRRRSILAYSAVYACISRIAADISKMPPVLKGKGANNIWQEITRNNPYLPVLRKPNDYQTRIQFFQQWIISKLIVGNTYILKQRDARGIVTRMYPLDPLRCRPLVTPDGSIYYELGYDPLSEQLDPMLIAPASEIIHDRMPAFFHPLVGTSPIFACGMAALQGSAIQKSSTAFFKNMARPSGILTAPGSISDDTAARLKKHWEDNYTGHKSGGVAVLGDALKFEPMTISAVDSQVIAQLKWSDQTVCTCFGMPGFIIGVGPLPALTNVEALNQMYYSQCLQIHVEDIELLLDEGLALPDAKTVEELGVELDTDVLMRMDTNARFSAWKTGISGGFMSPNQARAKESWLPVEGGDTPYLQQQNYSLAALNARDKAGPAPAMGATTTPALPNPNKPAAADDSNSADDGTVSDDDVPSKELLDLMTKGAANEYGVLS